MIASVAVFCGSQNGIKAIYVHHAGQLGKLLAERHIDLVYGGGNSGLMGTIANAALAAGGNVTGVIPQRLVDRERAHTGLSKIYIVNDMHTRKRKMYSLCDAVVILPGGNGTMDEMFETITWNVLKIHHKKIFLLNIDGFYDFLIAQMETMRREGFLYNHNEITCCRSADEVVEQLCLESSPH